MINGVRAKPDEGAARLLHCFTKREFSGSKPSSTSCWSVNLFTHGRVATAVQTGNRWAWSSGSRSAYPQLSWDPHRGVTHVSLLHGPFNPLGANFQSGLIDEQ